MPATFLDADNSTNNNTPYTSRRTTTTRRRLTGGNPLISQTHPLSSSSSSSSTRTITNVTPPPPTVTVTKKTNFTTASFRTLGCTASSQVSVPASIRSSANWEAKKDRKKNQSRNNPTDDVWCVPAIALSTTTTTPTDNTAAASSSSDRLKLDLDKKKKKKKNTNLREEERSSSSSTRRMMNRETVTFQGSNHGFRMPHHGLDEFRPRSFQHHVRTSPSPEGLSQIVTIQNRRLTGARIGGLDPYQEWRLNVDDMSYEDLLELGERIGSVNTGLKEEEIVHCLRKIKISSGTGGQEEEEEDDLLTDPTTQSLQHNCSICQEEYGEEDEIGELDCSHFFHSHCIEQWLVRKNSCPICKTAAIAE